MPAMYMSVSLDMKYFISTEPRGLSFLKARTRNKNKTIKTQSQKDKQLSSKNHNNSVIIIIQEVVVINTEWVLPQALVLRKSGQRGLGQAWLLYTTK